MDSGFRYRDGGSVGQSPLKTRLAQFHDVLLSVDRSGSAAAPGEDLNIQGDWFALDTSSVCALRCAFTVRDTQRLVQTMLLTPGRVVRVPFQSVRIFNDPVALENTLLAQGGPQPIVIRILWGIGDPLFDDRSLREGGRLVLPSATTSIATLATATYPVTEGTFFNAWWASTQVTAAGETSALRPQIQLNPPGAIIFPDVTVFTDQLVAGVGTAFFYALIRGLIIPRGVTSVVLATTRQAGNAVTNPIGISPVAELV